MTWSIGSEWLRWDPHIHTPGTLMNDQFRGDWKGYFTRIEQASPPPAVLGITDYCILRGYKEFLRQRGARLPSVQLVFPNVEMRLTIETRSGKGVNLHFLVSPNDPNHVARMEEQLSRLEFTYDDTTYPCSEAGLIRLGRAQPGKDDLPEEAALREGAGQFKVEFSKIRSILEDAWVKRNVLVAVAAGDDGLAGLRQDSGFRAQREELGRKVNIVFSGNSNDRLYWLGKHPAFRMNKQNPKPCIHGSDAHELGRVLKPDFDRRCWIRGGPTFESLRQTLVEPERRVLVASEPPVSAASDQTLSEARFAGTSWLSQARLGLNPGLVTVIGAKGSGKTALVDLLALGCGAEDEEPGPASFVGKARTLLRGAAVELVWGDGSVSTKAVDSVPRPDPSPQAQYLSQQFVDRLSSPTDLAEPLVDEIERVVFEAIPAEARYQTSSFDELRDVLLAAPRASQDFERTTIIQLTEAAAQEQALEQSVPALKSAAQAAERTRKGLEAEIARTPAPGGAAKASAATKAAKELQARRDAIAAGELRARQFGDVLAQTDREVRRSTEAWELLQARYPGLIPSATWALLRPRIDPDGRQALQKLVAEARETVDQLRAGSAADPRAGRAPSPSLQALIDEHARLIKDLGLDETNQRRRGEFEKRLVAAKADEQKAASAVANASGASARRKQASKRRLQAYRRVFDSFAVEGDRLRELYEPLSERVRQDSRLSKIGVVVRRTVDLESWAARGEALFDLRSGPFGRVGRLLEMATPALLEPWRGGTSAQVERAMSQFTEDNFVRQRPVLAQGVSWTNVGDWLFATNHIRVLYNIQYEGVPISRLSPGTRGVVLLTLYLGLDTWDLRPLLIDQPEENLDPSSIYGSLVPFFRDAAQRRQIVMVTHNANLVVNTDSDQVIVAQARRTSAKALPVVTYTSGGLEDPDIREKICALLEGGRDAFRKRSERYGYAVSERDRYGT